MSEKLQLEGLNSDFWDRDFRVPTVKRRGGKRHLRLREDLSFCGRFQTGYWADYVRATNPAKFVTCGWCFSLLCDMPERVGEDFILLILVGIHRFGHDPHFLPLAEQYRDTGDLTPLMVMADWWDEQGDSRAEVIRCTYELMSPEHRKNLTPNRYCRLVNTRDAAGRQWLGQARFGNQCWLEARVIAKREIAGG